MQAPLENYVSSVASQLCDTDVGAKWLTSYIDPAHGECYVFPDEDNSYSCAIRSKAIFSINKSFFVDSNYSGNVPNTFNFVIFSTNSPQYPIAVYGDFYVGSQTPKVEKRLIYIPDDQFSGFIPEINSARLLYKGFTATYTGNQYNTQGFISASTLNPTYAEGKMDDSFSGLADNAAKFVMLDFFPVTANDVSLMNRDFEVFATFNGIYGVNKYLGTRSDYKDITNANDNPYAFGFAVKGTVEGYTMKPCPNFLYKDRFNTTTMFGSYRYTDIICNWNIVAAAVDGFQSDQSILVKYYQGVQAHFKPNSSLVSMQTYKGYLDNGALTAASQLNSSLNCVYPSNYNDFRTIWRKIRTFMKSSKGSNLVNALAGAVGPYGALINAAYSLI